MIEKRPPEPSSLHRRVDDVLMDLEIFLMIAPGYLRQIKTEIGSRPIVHSLLGLIHRKNPAEESATPSSEQPAAETPNPQQRTPIHHDSSHH